MKCNAGKVVFGILIVALLVFAGCGGGGGGEGSATNVGTTNSLITSVGWIYEDAAPDYFNNGATCHLSVKLYYSDSVAAADIDSFGVTAPNGWQWTIPAPESQFGTSSSGKPYIGGYIYYGANPHTMPLAGTWVFQLKLKNGQYSSVQKTLHEPGSSADATRQFLYTKEDWTPSTNTSQYIGALGRFPAQSYKLEYDQLSWGRTKLTTLNNTANMSILAPFMALELRFYRQKGTSKNGESKPTSYSGAGVAYYPPLPQKGISSEIRQGQATLAFLAL